MVETDVGEYVKAGGGGDAKSDDAAILFDATLVARIVPLPVRSTAFEVVVLVWGLIRARTVPPDTVVEKSYEGVNDEVPFVG
jgi:hypothetical protein